MTLSIIWWLASARKWFKGPKVNVFHAVHGPDALGEVIEGKEATGGSETSSHEAPRQALVREKGV